MKLVSACFLVAALLSAGCRKESSSTAKSTNTSSTSSGNPITAPVDYLGTVVRAKQSAEKTVSTLGIDQAIKMFAGQEGRYPKTLNELVPEFLPSLPQPPAGMQYSYDPTTGVVKVVPK